MSVVADPPLLGDRARRQRARLSTLLPLGMLILALLLCPAAQESSAASRGRQPSSSLKFEAPPVDIDTPQGSAEEPANQPPAPAPAQTPGATSYESGGENAPSVANDPSRPIRLFGTVEFRSPIKNLPKWERVRDSEQKKPSFVDSGMDTQNAAVSEKWRALREKLQNASLMEKMKGVNSFFNQWPYKTDRDIWGVEDYWETPREFVQKSGDCEDYAISKYYGLRDLGVPVEVLRVVAVKDSIRNLGHAVTVVFVDNDAYVLDNLTGLILSHTRLTHYKPQFSVNEQFLWRHIQPQSGPTR